MKFLELLLLVLRDIGTVLRQFFRWNVGKILIICFSFVLAVISFVPFLIIIVILGFIDTIAWGEILLSFEKGTQVFELLNGFSTSPILFILEALLVVIGLGIAIGVFSYKSVLLFRLSDALLEKENHSWKDNFSLKYLKKYIQIFPRLFVILSIPVIVYIVYFFCVVFIFGGFSSVAEFVQTDALNVVSILLLIGFIFSAGWFLYRFYRLVFTYIVLQDEAYKELSAKDIIEKGYSFTKGKIIFSILALILLYGIVAMPLEQYGEYAASTSAEMSQYGLYKELAQLPDDFDFRGLNIGYDTKEDFISSITYTNAFSKYGGYDDEYLDSQSRNLAIQSRLLYFVHFFVFYGLFELILLSIYKHRIHSSLHQTPIKKNGLLAKMKQKFSSKKAEL